MAERLLPSHCPLYLLTLSSPPPLPSTPSLLRWCFRCRRGTPAWSFPPSIASLPSLRPTSRLSAPVPVGVPVRPGKPSTSVHSVLDTTFKALCRDGTKRGRNSSGSRRYRVLSLSWLVARPSAPTTSARLIERARDGAKGALACADEAPHWPLATVQRLPSFLAEATE